MGGLLILAVAEIDQVLLSDLSSLAEPEEQAGPEEEAK